MVRKSTGAAVFAAGLCILLLLSCSIQSGKKHIKSITLISTAAVAVEYDTLLDGSSISVAAYSVAGRSVTRAYTNSCARTADGAEMTGTFVILELSPAAGTADSHMVVQQSGDILTARGVTFTGGDEKLPVTAVLLP